MTSEARSQHGSKMKLSTSENIPIVNEEASRYHEKLIEIKVLLAYPRNELINKQEWIDVIANNFHEMLGENTLEMTTH